MRNNKERLLVVACTIEEDENRETPNEFKKRKNEWKTHWTQKHLHGQFIRQTMGKANEDRWDGLEKDA